MKTTHARLVAGVAAVAGLSVAMHQAQAHRSEAPSREQACTSADVIAFRSKLAAAITAKDKAKLRRMYSSAFIQTHGTGKQDGRDARIASVLGGDPVIETLAAENLDIRVHNAEGCSAVATGQSSRTMADGTVQLLAWTAVYLRHDEKWKLAASHVTRLAEAKK